MKQYEYEGQMKAHVDRLSHTDATHAAEFAQAITSTDQSVAREFQRLETFFEQFAANLVKELDAYGRIAVLVENHRVSISCDSRAFGSISIARFGEDFVFMVWCALEGVSYATVVHPATASPVDFYNLYGAASAPGSAEEMIHNRIGLDEDGMDALFSLAASNLGQITGLELTKNA